MSMDQYEEEVFVDREKVLAVLEECRVSHAFNEAEQKLTLFPDFPGGDIITPHCLELQPKVMKKYVKKLAAKLHIEPRKFFGPNAGK